MNASSLTLALETDSEIIEEYSSGNSELAATAFVRKHQNFVFSIALRYLQSYDDADDAAQVVFIKAFNNLKKFRGDSSIKTWLYRITINVCSNMKRKKKILSLFKRAEEEDYLDIPTDDYSPGQLVENKEFEERFILLLSKLPEKQRETFALRYFDKLPYEEISKMLGTSVGGLKANYYQAVKKLAVYLKKEYKEV